MGSKGSRVMFMNKQESISEEKQYYSFLFFNKNNLVVSEKNSGKTNT